MQTTSYPPRMVKRRHRPGTSFPTPPGTCFVMPDLPLPDLTDYGLRQNNHPFIVLTDSDEYVQCAMAQTIRCPYEHKDNFYLMEQAGAMIELDNPHPPMQSANIRSQGTDLSRIFLIPKKELYDAELFICCDGAINDPAPVLPDDTLDSILSSFDYMQKQHNKGLDRIILTYPISQNDRSSFITYLTDTYPSDQVGIDAFYHRHCLQNDKIVNCNARQEQDRTKPMSEYKQDTIRPPVGSKPRPANRTRTQYNRPSNPTRQPTQPSQRSDSRTRTPPGRRPLPTYQPGKPKDNPDIKTPGS